MKTLKRLILLLLLVVVILATIIVACKHTPSPQGEDAVLQQAIEEYYETQIKYSDYKFWQKENKIRLIHDYILTPNKEEDNEEKPRISHFVEVDEETKQKMESLKAEFIGYFIKIYNVKLDKKIEDQQVVFYEPLDNNENVLGFVDENSVFLSTKLLKEEHVANRLPEEYFRQTINQIGFDKKEGATITSAIAEVLVEDLCRETEISMVEPQNVPIVMQVAKQLIVADPQIVIQYIENPAFNIIESIDQKLKELPRENFQEMKLGKRVENTMSVAQKEGLTEEFKFELQEIIRAYCQECNPDEASIDFIRRQYIIREYEFLEVVENEEGGKQVE